MLSEITDGEINFLSDANSAHDFHLRTELIRHHRKGHLPIDWHEKVVRGGVVKTARAKWRW